MPRPNRDIVYEVLGERGRSGMIRSAISDAWSTVMKKYPERAWWRRKSMRAGLMWEHSVQNVITLLDSDVGFKLVAHNDTVSFIFDQAVLLRCKKADLELRSRNYPTLQALLFHDHETELPGFEDLHRVEVAYILNRFETKIDWIGVVARQKKQILWRIDLDASATIERLPLPERTETAAEKVMRPKFLPESKREDESE